MRGKINLKLRAECVRLRLEERLSHKEISLRTGAALGSISAWLRTCPLTSEEQTAKRLAARHHVGPRVPRLKYGIPSKMYELALQPLTSDRKSKIAEVAVMFRAVLVGLEVYGSPFDGDKADWIIARKNGRLLRLQVRSVGEGRYGRPTVSLLCSAGRNKFRRFREGEFDILVGYDLLNDAAYIWLWSDLINLKTSATVTDTALERWDKIVG